MYNSCELCLECTENNLQFSVGYDNTIIRLQLTIICSINFSLFYISYTLILTALLMQFRSETVCALICRAVTAVTQHCNHRPNALIEDCILEALAITCAAVALTRDKTGFELTENKFQLIVTNYLLIVSLCQKSPINH